MNPKQLLQVLFNLLNAPRDFPMKVLKDRVSGIEPESSIPGVVYQTWESNRFTRRLHKSIEEFRLLNHDLSFVLYDSHKRDQYMKEHWGEREIYEAYRRAAYGPLKADLFRYCILFEKGGWYFDISKGATLPLTSFTKAETTELITFEGNLMPSEENPDDTVSSRLLRSRNRVAQWGFGFAPKHPLLDLHIRGMENNFPAFSDRLAESVKETILEFSGPLAFTRSVWTFLEADIGRALNQVDTDLNGSSIYALDGAGARYWQSPSYVAIKNHRIFHPPA